MKELLYIQENLHAPKDAYNKYGNYKYRKAEQILEAAKPLLAEKKCTLVISDDVVVIGSSIYVKATSTLTNEDGDSVSAVGWAREADSLAGMSPGQVTGATSSYARKYSLCGLFAIDDTKDLDDEEVTNPQGAQKPKAAPKPAAPKAAPAPKPAPAQNIDKKAVLAEIEAANSTAQLNDIYHKYESLQGDADFMNSLSNKKKQILGVNGTANS